MMKGKGGPGGAGPQDAAGADDGGDAPVEESTIHFF